jgi:ABC-2 type transport system ATP-binding protein
MTMNNSRLLYASELRPVRRVIRIRQITSAGQKVGPTVACTGCTRLSLLVNSAFRKVTAVQDSCGYGAGIGRSSTGAGTSPPALKTVDLHVSYGAKDVLSGVSIEVRRGLISALLGANGSGKSTFVRAIAGILPPDCGSIEIDGHSLAKEPECAKRHLGALVDGFALFDDLSLWEQALLIEQVYGVPTSVLKQRSEAIFRDLGLWTFRNRRAREASFGTQKKCAIALALIHRPELIVLDEAFEDLDLPTAHNLIGILRAFARTGSGILVVSHLLEVIESFAGDFWILAEGRVQAHWSSADIRSSMQPLASRFAGIVGENPEPDLAWIESPRS